jgi:hypothetical protein
MLMPNLRVDDNKLNARAIDSESNFDRPLSHRLGRFGSTVEM